MERRFANTTTPNDPDLANLQRVFWDLAVERFGRIKANAGQADFYWSTFATEAAVVIVLAGTAISELLGQNTPLRQDGTVQSPKGAAKAVYGSGSVPAEFDDFIDVYDALRHFGEPKRELIRSLMDDAGRERLCSMLNAAGDVWSKVIGDSGAPHYPHSTYRFSFEGFGDDGRASDGDG